MIIHSMQHIKYELCFMFLPPVIHSCHLSILAKEAWLYSLQTTKKAQDRWISRLYLPHGNRNSTNSERDTKAALCKLQGYQPCVRQRLRQTAAGWVEELIHYLLHQSKSSTRKTLCCHQYCSRNFSVNIVIKRIIKNNIWILCIWLANGCLKLIEMNEQSLESQMFLSLFLMFLHWTIHS